MPRRLALRRGPAALALRIAGLVGVAGAVAGWSSPARALDPSKSPTQYVAHGWHQTDDGLPQNIVTGIAQTPDGYLWLATQEGLVRFDGARFTTLTSRDYPALRSNDVFALLCDRKGVLWLGTRGGGLSRYLNGELRTYLPKDGLAHEFVESLMEDRDGSLWIGSRGGGVSHLQGETFTNYRTKDGLANDRVSAITQLADGTIWFGTDGGLSRFKDGAFTTVGIGAGLSHPVIGSLLHDDDGTLWVGTKGGGLNRLKDGAFTTLRAQDGLGNDSVLALFRDHDRNLWIGTDGGGLRRLSSARDAPGVPTPLGTLSPLTRVHEENLFIARTFFEDRESNVWVGLENFGLLRLEDGKVTTFGIDDGLPNDNTWSMLVDPAGQLWVGTKSGLGRQAGARFEAGGPATDAALAGGDILALAPSRGGGLWVGTDGLGLVRRDASGGTTVLDTRHGLPNDTIRSLHEDPSGALWLGTYRNGVVRVIDGKVETFDTRAGFPNVVASVFADGPDGSLWIGTDGGGIARRKDDRFTVSTTADGLTNDIIQALYVDDDGSVWIGTYGGGLNHWRDGKITHVTSKQGLFNDNVYAILDDGLGNLWMTCNKGIFRASKRELVEVAEGRRPRVASVGLGTLDGMRSSECNGGSPGAARTRDGRMWFATVAGLAMIDPAHMHRNPVAPPVRIEEVEVDHAPVDLAAIADIAPGSQNFELHYTALSFTSPERVRFKYRLDGFDKDWVDAGTRRVAYYTNLAPGPYHFRVIAANDDGVWNEAGAEVAFRLKPRFFQTIPFYLACAFGLMLIGAGSVRLRLLALRQRARELEQKVDERTRQLAKANDDLQGAFKSLAEKDARLHEDLLQAQAFQQGILPRIPDVGPLCIRTLYRPADLVGGDVYDVCELSAGRYRVFMADTTGHGVQASLRTMVLKTEYDRLKLADEGPAHVLTELNRKIAKVYPGLEMRCSACCFDVQMNGDGGANVRYANAAHPPLLRVGPGGVEEIYAAGTFLGMVDEVSFRETELHLDRGDLLVAYTDGVCEQEDPKGQPFGLERMQEILGSIGLDADGAVTAIDREVTRFASGRPLDDDIAIVCIECAPGRASRA